MQKIEIKRLILYLAAVLFFTNNSFAVDYQIIDLGTLGGLPSSARDINDNGQIIGISQTISGNWHPFLYNGVMSDLGTLGGLNSFANAINNDGQIVGYSLTDAGVFICK